MLSDVGSRVIRAFGLLNEHVREQHAANNVPWNDAALGVPYPGVFVLNAEGIIVDKRFYDSYRERETGVGLLENALNVASARHGAEEQQVADAVQVRAYLDSPTFAYSQRLRLTVELTIAPGFHVYAAPTPEGYVPLSMEVAPIQGLVVGAPSWPPSRPFQFEGLDESFRVYDGDPRVSIPLTFGLPAGSGDQSLSVTIAFQACDATTCFLPRRVTLSLPVTETGLVDRPLPR